MTSNINMYVRGSAVGLLAFTLAVTVVSADLSIVIDMRSQVLKFITN